MIDKRISMDEAVEWIETGTTLALGGMTLYRRPFAFIRGLIQHNQQCGEPKDLTLLAFTCSLESDLLVGAGLVSRTRTCYFGLEIFGLAPMFTFYANCGELEVLEETEASLAFGLRARLAGVGFMPGRAWIGTDLPKLRPDVCRVIDPYSGEELMAFPAILPDIAVIHALQADPEGNACIGENQGVDIELALAADQVIVTTEEIVPELSKADLVSPIVSAIVLAPHGARPSSCHPSYPLDGEAYLSYVEQVSDPASFAHFLKTWLI